MILSRVAASLSPPAETIHMNPDFPIPGLVCCKSLVLALSLLSLSLAPVAHAANLDLTEIGSISTPNDARDVAVVGDFAYVGVGSGGILPTGGLRVIDISIPTAPVEVGSVELNSHVYGLTVVGDYAYLAAETQGLHVIDVSDPTTPVLVGTIRFGTQFLSDVAVVGDFAYLVAGVSLGPATGDLHVVDISDPTAPVEVGSLDGLFPSDVLVVSDFAYVATSDLVVIDVSDPTTPVEVGSYHTAAQVRHVSVVGNYAYVTDLNTGLRVIDISDPTAPAFVGVIGIPGSPHSIGGVSKVGDLAYVVEATNDPLLLCCMSHGGSLRLIDVSDPTALVEVGSIDISGRPQELSVVGDLVYIANGDNGLTVIRVPEPGRLPSALAALSAIGALRIKRRRSPDGGGLRS